MVKKIIVLVVLALTTSGCGMKMGTWQLPNGLDFHIGVNGIDHVDNNRGVNVEQKSGVRASRRY